MNDFIHILQIDKINSMWSFESGNVSGVLQSWRHGCTIHHFSGIDHFDEAVVVLDTLKQNYGSVRVIGLDVYSPEIKFWTEMLNRGMVSSLGDKDFKDIHPEPYQSAPGIC